MGLFRLTCPPPVDRDDGDVVVILYANVSVWIVEDIARHLGGDQ